MMTYEIKVRKWLWITLIIVVILGGGFTYWNIKGGKEIATTKTSPTPTKSVVASPSAGTTTTPTSGKTSTPTPGQIATPTATPTSTPPAGWKQTQFSIYVKNKSNIGATYSVFIKNDWLEKWNNLLPASVRYAPPSSFNSCSSYDQEDYQNYCSLIVSIGEGNSPTNVTTKPTLDNDGYVSLSFGNISEPDKSIIQNSFLILE